MPDDEMLLREVLLSNNNFRKQTLRFSLPKLSKAANASVMQILRNRSFMNANALPELQFAKQLLCESLRSAPRKASDENHGKLQRKQEI